jgi:hypothetical protein
MLASFLISLNPDFPSFYLVLDVDIFDYEVFVIISFGLCSAVLSTVNAIHLIIFGVLGMATEFRVGFILNGISFLKYRSGKGNSWISSCIT